jgi:hypothetical protein
VIMIILAWDIFEFLEEFITYLRASFDNPTLHVVNGQDSQSRSFEMLQYWVFCSVRLHTPLTDCRQQTGLSSYLWIHTFMKRQQCLLVAMIILFIKIEFC